MESIYKIVKQNRYRSPTRSHKDHDQDGDSQRDSKTHPSSSLMTSHLNPWWMSSRRHRGRNDSGATFGGETLNKTYNNKNLNPNGVVTTDYKGFRDMGRPMDTLLLGSDMIHSLKDKIWCRNTWTNSGKLIYSCDSGWLKF
jgi:hypothetical protein